MMICQKPMLNQQRRYFLLWWFDQECQSIHVATVANHTNWTLDFSLMMHKDVICSLIAPIVTFTENVCELKLKIIMSN